MKIGETRVKEFAQKHGLRIKEYEDPALSIDRPKELVAYFRSHRFAMSSDESYLEEITLSKHYRKDSRSQEYNKKINRVLSPSEKAGGQYALHSRHSFIADSDEKTRQVVALVALY